MDKAYSNLKKMRERLAKKRSIRLSRAKALPPVPRVILNENYVNPVTLSFPKRTVVYEIKNRFTGRTDYYNKETFRKLITAFRTDYELLMANPKAPIPGVRNPVTRNPIYPRNIRKVAVVKKKRTPSPKTAAKTIQKAVKKHLSKKRKTPVRSK